MRLLNPAQFKSVQFGGFKYGPGVEANSESKAAAKPEPDEAEAAGPKRPKYSKRRSKKRGGTRRHGKRKYGSRRRRRS